MDTSVFILEDDPDLTALLEEFFTSHGFQVMAVASVQSMVEQRHRALGCTTAFLDIELGEGRPDGIDAFRWFKHQHFKGHVYFLTGHGKNHAVLEKLRSLGSEEVDVLAKPISPRLLLNLAQGGKP